MPIPFIDRPPTQGEFEKLRLLLSTFQDGTGQNHGGLKPGWRDFERVIAVLLDGEAVESKAIFDVQVPDPVNPAVKYGIACKMRREMSYLDRTGKLTLELSNADKRFWAELQRNGIDRANFRNHPDVVGRLIVRLVERWQNEVSTNNGGDIDLSKSSYFVLTYHPRTYTYILHQLGLPIPDPDTLHWSYPSESRLLGELNGEKLFEWYFNSGGQLKYYPRADSAIWTSERFTLEPLPPDAEANSVLAKAQAYFPVLWKHSNR